MTELRTVHIVPCKPGQIVKVTLDQGTDPAVPIGRFFSEDGIDIMISHVPGGEVKIAVTAPAGLTIRRHDLSY